MGFSAVHMHVMHALLTRGHKAIAVDLDMRTRLSSPGQLLEARGLGECGATGGRLGLITAAGALALQLALAIVAELA